MEDDEDVPYDPSRTRFVPRMYNDEDEDDVDDFRVPEPTYVEIPEPMTGAGHVSWAAGAGAGAGAEAEPYAPSYKRTGTANTSIETNDRIVERLGTCDHNQEIVAVLNTIQGLRKERSMLLTEPRKTAAQRKELEDITRDLEALRSKGRVLLRRCGFDERSIPSLLSSFGAGRGEKKMNKKMNKVRKILRILNFL